MWGGRGEGVGERKRLGAGVCREKEDGGRAAWGRRPWSPRVPQSRAQGRGDGEEQRGPLPRAGALGGGRRRSASRGRVLEARAAGPARSRLPPAGLGREPRAELP